MIMSTASCNVEVQIRYALQKSGGLNSLVAGHRLILAICPFIGLLERCRFMHIPGEHDFHKIQDRHLHLTPFLELSSALRRWL